MYCPNCGEQIPDLARVCGFCGHKLRAHARPPRAQGSQPIIVHTSGGGGIFSGCGSLLNFILTAMVIGLIAIMALVFLCVIRLPSSFPIINPPVQLGNLWDRAVAWQGQSCELPASSGSRPSSQTGQDEVENPGNACNRSKFVSETVKDHTAYAPGEAFTKTWTVRNDGSCTWTTDYTFRFTQGDRMMGEKSIPLFHDVAPGETYTFELDLVAPDDPGTYTGRWEISDENGDSFGWYSVVIDVVEEGAPGKLPDATVYVEPSVGDKCSNFSIQFSGYAANEQIALEFAYFTDAGQYTTYDKIYADGNGEASYRWYADVTLPGQYIIWGRSSSAIGSAVFIVESDNECACDGVCPASACSQAETEADCVATGGEWRHIFMDPGPSQDICICPGESPF